MPSCNDPQRASLVRCFESLLHGHTPHIAATGQPFNLSPPRPTDASGQEQNAAPTCRIEDPDFYERNSELGKEVVEGIVREKQIIALAGAYGIGKSPALCDLTVRLVRGISWCGRNVSARPVIVFDFESPAAMYKQNVQNISRRLGVAAPVVPDELDVYLMLDDPSEPATEKLLTALSEPREARLRLIEEALQRKPRALVIIDPVEMMFPIDKMKGKDILWLYRKLRGLLSKFPNALFLLTFNLRKRDRRNLHRATLLNDPRSWLEEVSGVLDIAPSRT